MGSFWSCPKCRECEEPLSKEDCMSKHDLIPKNKNACLLYVPGLVEESSNVPNEYTIYDAMIKYDLMRVSDCSNRSVNDIDAMESIIYALNVIIPPRLLTWMKNDDYNVVDISELYDKYIDIIKNIFPAVSKNTFQEYIEKYHILLVEDGVLKYDLGFRFKAVMTAVHVLHEISKIEKQMNDTETALLNLQNVSISREQFNDMYSYYRSVDDIVKDITTFREKLSNSFNANVSYEQWKQEYQKNIPFDLFLGLLFMTSVDYELELKSGENALVFDIIIIQRV